MSHSFLDHEAIVKDGCLVLNSLKRKALSGNVPAMKAFIDFAFSLEEEKEELGEQVLSEDQQRRIMDICREGSITDQGEALHEE